MKDLKIKAAIVLFSAIFLGCTSAMESEGDLLTTFDFESGTQNWNGGISDFPVDFEDSLDFSISNNYVKNSFSSDEAGDLRTGVNISGDNPHGDLFYFFNRNIKGLKPNQSYFLDFEFLVYAQLIKKPEKLSSEELYLKLGAVNYQPELEDVVWRNSIEYKALNIEKGEVNGEGGKDMLNIGSIKNFTTEVPEIISGNTFDTIFELKTNDLGEIWIVIGVDSGVRSYLTFGMEALTVYYREKN